MSVRSIPLLFLLVAAGCAASAQSQSAQAGGEGQNNSSLTQENGANDEQDVTGPSQCLDDDNEPLQCERDADCCPHFYCGWDPQVSDVLKVCVSSGS
jgi:hypothetical protein